MPTTYRRDTKDRLVTVLEAFKTANPTLLARVYRARPESSPEVPYIYIDTLSEDVAFSQQIRTRTLSGLAFVLIDRITPNAETALRQDIVVDALIEHLSDYPQMGGTVGIWSRMRVTDEDAPFGDYDYVGTRFAFPDIDIEEGHQ